MKTVLAVTLFSGLITMILKGNRFEVWIRFLLTAVLLISLIGSLRTVSFVFPDEGDILEETVADTEAAESVLAQQVQAAVCSVSGEAPIGVSCRMIKEDGSVRKILISVTVRRDEGGRIQNELSKTYAGAEIRIEETEGSGLVGGSTVPEEKQESSPDLFFILDPSDDFYKKLG